MRFVTACEKQFPIIWHAAAVEALADAAVRTRLAELGQDVFPRDQQTSQALAALQPADSEKWWPIIKATNIKGE